MVTWYGYDMSVWMRWTSRIAVTEHELGVLEDKDIYPFALLLDLELAIPT
jgi:hypothetical protein